MFGQEPGPSGAEEDLFDHVDCVVVSDEERNVLETEEIADEFSKVRTVSVQATEQVRFIRLRTYI